MRDRRYDWLYERRKQPVRQYILERFARELADELAAWPPASLEWESEALRRRFEAGAAARPRQAVLRLGLELSALDLRRDWDGVERRLAAAPELQSEAERAAVHLLVRLVTERCLSLKEHAEGAHLTRQDLVGALDLVERHLFRVTLG